MMLNCTVAKPESFCSAIIDFQSTDSYREVYWDIILVLGSFGIVCNIISIVVLRYKSVRSINLLLWWLAVTDLLKILGIVSEEWCDIIIEDWESSLHCIISYLLWNTFHTITVGLNTILAFFRYQAVAHVEEFQKSRVNFRTIQLSVLGIYILGFALNVPTAMYLASEYLATVCHANYLSSEMAYVLLNLISNVLPCVILVVISVK